MDNKTKHKFKVIKGGLKFRDKNEISSYVDTLEYQSGYAFNTFLHREMCMHVVWVDRSVKDDELYFHEFIHFSYSENIFVNYITDTGEESQEIAAWELPMRENLGADAIPISEGIAKYLFHDFIIHYQNDESPFAYEQEDPVQEKEFLKHIMASPLVLEEKRCNKDEFLDFLPNICILPKTQYGLINYFLMNLASQSTDVLTLLCTPDMDLSNHQINKKFVLHRNNIEKCDDGFCCESLLISSESAQIATFKFDIDFQAMRIKSFHQVCGFNISNAEVAMILHRFEYVTVFNMLSVDEELISASLFPLTNGAAAIEYDYGYLFAIMDPELQYIDSPNFITKDKFIGSIFINEASQLILVSLNMENMRFLERAISYSPLNRNLVPNGRFEFQEPTFYEYLYSDFVLFEEFVSFFNE